jgi:hypothetical protein
MVKHVLENERNSGAAIMRLSTTGGLTQAQATSLFNACCNPASHDAPATKLEALFYVVQILWDHKDAFIAAS